jgi:hypothetical protein
MPDHPRLSSAWLVERHVPQSRARFILCSFATTWCRWVIRQSRGRPSPSGGPITFITDGSIFCFGRGRSWPRPPLWQPRLLLLLLQQRDWALRFAHCHFRYACGLRDFRYARGLRSSVAVRVRACAFASLAVTFVAPEALLSCAAQRALVSFYTRRRRPHGRRFGSSGCCCCFCSNATARFASLTATFVAPEALLS